MMFSDFKYIFIWWLTFFLLGTITLPFIFSLFNKFWDRGYIFAKIFSLVLLSYLIFVLSVFHLLPFNHLSLYSIICLMILASVFFLRRNNNLHEFISVINKNWPSFLFEELCFFLILTGWSFVRGFAPDIEGLEKFMDWGFVNSILRGQYFPPIDMWFSGFSINYYYFGHLISAVLTKLSHLDSAITYNLSIASICSLTFVETLSLSSNLVYNSLKKLNYRHLITAGIISALILTFGGNLHAVYKILKTNIQDNHRLLLSKTALFRAAESYWYPDATRFIGFDPDIKDKTIHEFPIYSFVVADLHGHMNDIPVILFFLAFIFSLSISAIKKSPTNWLFIIMTGFVLSIAYMTNAWDFAVYGLVFAIFNFIRLFYQQNFEHSLKQTFTSGVLIIFFWYLFTLPFSLNFIPMAEGLRLSDSHTPFYQLFILYGGFWLICLPFIFQLIFQLLRRVKINLSDLFVFSLILTATILIIIPEIGYIKDIYIYEHRRANTMFKLVYQAFILYSLLSGYILIKLKSNFIYKIIFSFIFICHLIYPYFAIKSYYGLNNYKGLWGINFIKSTYPDNFAVINWLNTHVLGQPVILEAVGDSYTQNNQVSMATGLPTVEGWIVHEWLWRGGYDQPAARQADVQKIYESENIIDAQKLLTKYSVKYILVGDQEREKYPKLNEAIFSDLGAKIVFESGQTRLYQL